MIVFIGSLVILFPSAYIRERPVSSFKVTTLPNVFWLDGDSNWFGKKLLESSSTTSEEMACGFPPAFL